MCTYNGDVLISGCNFIYNEAERGGAIFTLTVKVMVNKYLNVPMIITAIKSNLVVLSLHAHRDSGYSFNGDKSSFSSGQSTLEGSAINFIIILCSLISQKRKSQTLNRIIL